MSALTVFAMRAQSCCLASWPHSCKDREWDDQSGLLRAVNGTDQACCFHQLPAAVVVRYTHTHTHTPREIHIHVYYYKGFHSGRCGFIDRLQSRQQRYAYVWDYDEFIWLKRRAMYAFDSLQSIFVRHRFRGHTAITSNRCWYRLYIHTDSGQEHNTDKLAHNNADTTRNLSPLILNLDIFVSFVTNLACSPHMKWRHCL